MIAIPKIIVCDGFTPKPQMTQENKSNKNGNEITL